MVGSEEEEETQYLSLHLVLTQQEGSCLQARKPALSRDLPAP